MMKQRAKTTVFLLFSLLIAHSAWLRADDSLIQQAQAAWDQRDQAGQTERAITLWREALKTTPAQHELLIKLTKACGRAVRHAANSTERKRWADEARAYGREAVKQNPGASDAYAYYAEALGQWADLHKGLQGLKLVKQAVQNLQKAIALNPQNYYAYMLLSQFYRQAPSYISIGDKRKAVEEGRLAVHHGPAYAINHLALARALLSLGQKTEAVEHLKTILSLTPPADAVPETHADQETARELLVKMGFSPPVIAGVP